MVLSLVADIFPSSVGESGFHFLTRVVFDYAPVALNKFKRILLMTSLPVCNPRRFFARFQRLTYHSWLS